MPAKTSPEFFALISVFKIPFVFRCFPVIGNTQVDNFSWNEEQAAIILDFLYLLARTYGKIAEEEGAEECNLTL